MAKVWNKLKNSITSKTLKYSDDFLKFKSDAKITEDSFTFSMYPAMQNAVDIKTNNYSNFVLSKNQLNSDWVDLDIKKFDYKNGIVTTLGFFAHNETLTTPPYYIYFDKNYEFWDLYIKQAPYSLVAGTPGEAHGNHTFFIEFIDDIKCKIRHWFGDLIFYLSVNSEKTIQFSTIRNEDTDFIYNIDGSRMMLYKKVVSTKKESMDFKAAKKDIPLPTNQELYDFTSYYAKDNDNNFILRESCVLIKDIKNYDIDFNSGSDEYEDLCKKYDIKSDDIFNSSDAEYKVFIKLYQDKNNNVYRKARILNYSDKEYPIYFEKLTKIDLPDISKESIKNWIKSFIVVARDNTFLTTNISEEEYNNADDFKGKATVELKETKVYKLAVIVDSETKNATLLLDENLDPDDNGIITISTGADVEFNPNSSYVKYDRSVSVNSIDMYYSQFNLQNQVLFHHEYNTENNINFIPLKNHLTYKGSSIRGNNTTISQLKHADVNFRKYNSVNTGFNQEFGTDNVVLTYTFEDQEYVINPGEDLFIYIPEENPELGIYPLHPYHKMNIADTKFIKNGAFASNNPYLADKIKKLQNKTSLTTENYTVEDNKVITLKTKEPAYENGGTYLCTWLYQKDAESDPIWLDRYYYPDLISRQKALKEPKGNLSKTLGSIIDKNYIDIEDHVIKEEDKTNKGIESLIEKGKQSKELIDSNPFFDKVSDMVIEPGCKYKFSHLSEEMVSNILFNNSFDRINIIENNLGNQELTADYMNFDGKNYRRIDYSKWNKTNAINFNTDLYIDPSKPMGIQLFGTDYCSGFNIQNRKDLAPLHYYTSENSVYLFDDNYVLSRKFSVYEKYKEKIKRLILGNTFDDVIIMADQCLYFLSYDLKVKSRMEYKDIPGLVSKPGIINGIFKFDTSNSEISTALSKYNPIFYKNNLYIPYKQDIIKIVLIPENEIDQEYIKNNILVARILDDTEYYVTYNKKDNGDSDTESFNLENGFINVECKIKHIYIDKDDNIYGLNFDQYSLAPDCDTIYGIYNSEIDKAQGGWSWVFNTRLSKIRARLSTAKYAEFGSPNSIDWVRFNSNYEMGLIRNFSNTLVNTNKDNNKRMEIYDRTKRLIYTIDMSAYVNVYAFDSYNYITQDGEERTVFVAFADKSVGVTPQLYKIMYISGGDTIGKVEEEYIIDVKEFPSQKMFEMLNNNALMRYHGTNKLYFNLYLPSVNMYNKALTIEWDIADIQTGWYNINVAIDLKDAIFELRINDVIYSTITSENNSDFVKNINADGVIFNTTYYIGCIGKQYGTTLNDVLSSNRYDAYICKNCRIENMSIYTKHLSYYEYQAMRLGGKPIYPLSLTLPCGARNNIEEIVRYFKYTYPGSVSNKVKINISGTGLTNKGEFEILRNEILSALREETDCLVDINDIEFI